MPAPSSSFVLDVSTASFIADVIEASDQRLVIVDFWAPWCGPCKQLGPVLEKLVRALGGAVRLAKVNIDENPDIASQMQIQSIPAVFAFFKGRPVDGFMGAQPEATLKDWLDKLIEATGSKAPVDDEAQTQALLEQAEAFLGEGNVAEAKALFTQIHTARPDHAGAYAGLLKCLIAEKDFEGAQKLFEAAPAEIAKAKALESVRASLALWAETASKSGELGALRAKVESAPDDLQSRFDLALAAFAAGEREEAVESLLEIIRRNRSWNEDAARLQLVKFFDAFGQTDPLTIATRKRLSSLLFS